MKKILQCLMGLEIGGAETHVVELSKELARRGYEVIVASNGGIYEQDLLDSGIKIVRIPMHSKKPKYVLKSIIMLNNLIKQYKPDIVHAHARIPALYVRLFEKKYKYQMITTVHGSFKINWLLKNITQWGKKIVVVSEDLKKYITENYPIKEAEIFKTVNGIDTERYKKTINNYPYKTIIHVSRLDFETSKLAEFLIKYAENSELNFIIVGGGTELQRLKNISKTYNNIIFTGPTNRVDDELKMGDVFVGISRSALEAMSMNIPVILGGNYGYMGILTEKLIGEAIENNFTARVETKLTYDKFKKDLDELLMMRPDLFNWERLFVQENYSIKKMTDDYIQVYYHE